MSRSRPRCLGLADHRRRRHGILARRPMAASPGGPIYMLRWSSRLDSVCSGLLGSRQSDRFFLAGPQVGPGLLGLRTRAMVRQREPGALKIAIARLEVGGGASAQPVDQPRLLRCVRLDAVELCQLELDSAATRRCRGVLCPGLGRADPKEPNTTRSTVNRAGFTAARGPAGRSLPGVPPRRLAGIG